MWQNLLNLDYAQICLPSVVIPVVLLVPLTPTIVLIGAIDRNQSR